MEGNGNTAKAEEITRILNYWGSVEFLGQDDFKTSTGNTEHNKSRIREQKEKNREHRRKGEKVEKPKYVLPDFIPIPAENPEKDGMPILSYVKEEAMNLGYSFENDGGGEESLPWKNLTVFVGKVRRQACIEQLSAEIRKSVQAPENDEDEIALACFTLTARGQIPSDLSAVSLSLSPVVWAVSRVSEIQDLDVAEKLSVDQYNQENLKLSEQLFREDDGKTLSPARLREIYHRLKTEYLDPYGLCTAEIGNGEYYGIKVHYTSETSEEDLEDKAITSLSMNFFSQDLSIVREKMQEKDPRIMPGLEDYITAAARENEPMPHRRELIRPENADQKDELERFLLEVLNVGNAPLGKWPSRYNPSLMQQVAVNCAVSAGKEGAFQEYGTIFSVNGPPGTGKTTMLKEIIAANIVKKAEILAQYDNSDDAFEEHSFKHGDRSDHSYTDYCQHYYSFQNDELNSCSILVASSNNAAVENISREMPIVKGGTWKDLSPEEKDSPELKGHLAEIASLFSPGNQDIYFSREAENLFSADKNKKKVYPNSAENKAGNPSGQDSGLRNTNPAWGLVAVPLGNRKNIGNFCNFALQDIRHPKNKKKTEERAQEFQDAKVAFKKQWRTVKEKQKELSDLGDLAEDLKRQEIRFKTQYGKTPSWNDLNAEVKAARTAVEITAAELNELEREFSEVEKFLNPLNWLRNRKEYESAKEQKPLLDRQIKEKMEELKSAEKVLKDYREVQEAHSRYSLKLRSLFPDEKSTKVTEPDISFFEKLFSEDEKESTEAQVSNPWVTDEYNCERMKLLYDALRLTEAFILSSKKCLTNLDLLWQYWGNAAKKSKDSNPEKIKFHPEDREAMATPLFQTLFLLVPVLSTTFASVGSMFRDVKDPGVIGTLIIDEAGQAQPQMAVGALYRSRRAIIVGDPKQIEPVVTEDQKLLRSCYNRDDLLRLYTGDKLSVQKFADILNPFGTSQGEGEDGEWLGCPLLVHRRCIRPMYDISNRISYDGIMKYQTAPPKKAKEEHFLFRESVWIDVGGEEKEDKNHYIIRQGNLVCQILQPIIAEQGLPKSLYIISPFKTVVSGIKNRLRNGLKDNMDINEADLKRWLLSNIGTVHTFQGKEADEVIFLLGCDDNNKRAVKWVNSNLVNVAVTRAKYRVCIIGDQKLWTENNKYLKTAGELIGTTVKGLNELSAVLNRS